MRRRAKQNARRKSKKLAESLFYRLKNPGKGNHADNFTEEELEAIGLGYDRMVRFMEKDDPNLRHPYDWYKYGEFRPYSWRGVVVGDPIRGRFSDERVTMIGYFWVFVRHPNWRLNELPWEQWTLVSEVVVEARKTERLDKWSLMGRLGNKARSLITKCAAWMRPDIIYVKKPVYQCRFEPQDDFFKVLVPFLDPKTEGQFMFEVKKEDGNVEMCSYFEGLCKIVKVNQKAFVDSIVAIQRILEVFYYLSGLKFNAGKSELFLGGVNAGLAEQMIQVSGFREGRLPVRYLGVPLVTRKLMIKDCEPLIMRMRERIGHWSNRFLSYAGRVQLIQAVLFSVKDLVSWNKACFEHCIWKRKDKVYWSRLIWNPYVVPRHGFVTWLVFLGKLPTKDRLRGWGLQVSKVCKLCGKYQETRDHLFFDCDFSKEVWQLVLDACSISRRVSCWTSELQWMIQKVRGKALISGLLRSAWCAYMYFIWQERNGREHGQQHHEVEYVFEQIQWTVRIRCSQKKNTARDPINSLLLRNWSITESILMD
ncbi:hypothetical protein PTKIN_Ptkin14bG0169200 [Pterospermum kingtungense]